jgi:hypothetical protein
MFAGVRGPRYRRNKQVLLGNWSFVMEKIEFAEMRKCASRLSGHSDRLATAHMALYAAIKKRKTV